MTFQSDDQGEVGRMSPGDPDRVAQKLTDFFIIGNSKSGTTALHKFLDQHPMVCMSSPKEPNFFATDLCHDVCTGIFTQKTLEEYHGCFHDDSGRMLRGESSACYLYSKAAAQAIQQYNPRAKMIAIFREPVEFLHSYHLQLLENPASEGEVEDDLDRALQLEEQRKAGRLVPEGCLVPELLYYTERIKYGEHLERFLQHFRRDQIKIIIYEDFSRDNAKVFREILEFLDVDSEFRPDSFDRHNDTKLVKSEFARNIAETLPQQQERFVLLRRIVRAVCPKPIRQFLIGLVFDHVLHRPKPALDSDLDQRLKRRFLPHVKAFSDLIGRDMVREWGYDAVQKDGR